MPENLGNLGSFLQGTTGALWALAALLLVYGGLLTQVAQLTLQRTEIARALDNSQSETKAFTQQLHIIRRQLAEDRFHSFMNAHMLLVSNIHSSAIEQDGLGCYVFAELAKRFRKIYGESGNPGNRERAFETAKTILLHNEPIFSPYMKGLRFLLTYVQNHLGSDGLFMWAVKSHLSQDEVFLLFYLIPVLPDGDSIWSPLAKTCDLFGDLDPLLLLNPDHAAFHYAN